MKSHQFFRFLVAGGIAAAANVGSRILLSLWLAYVPAIIVAFVIGITTAFVLNRLFVFKGAVNTVRNQMGWFTLVNLIAVAQTLIISVGLADYVFPAVGGVAHAQTIAHGIGVIVPLVTSYLGHKHFSFRT
jgi:putative flippase GtrA